MHGTFRSQIEGGATISVRFDSLPVPAATTGKRRAKWAALLAGCCVAALPHATNTDSSAPQVRILLPPVPKAEQTTPPTVARDPAKQIARTSRKLAVPRIKRIEPGAHASQAAELEPSGRTFAPEQPAEAPSLSSLTVADPTNGRVNVTPAIVPLEQPTQTETAQLPEPVLVVAEQTDIAAPELATVKLPDTAAPLLAVTEAPPAPLPAFRSTDAPRPVDIAQLSDSEVPSLRIQQVHEPDPATDGEPTLAAKIADMQVTPLPPAHLRDSDRALLLAEAPTQMTVRVGNSALGKVDFRMTDARTIDVRLSGLLDLLADHYDASEFARLRSSAAADSFVSFDQLRALGLKLRYDPVYDELRING